MDIISDKIPDLLCFANGDYDSYKESVVDVNANHKELGHPNFDDTTATACMRNTNLEGSVAPCSSCALGKARQRRILKNPKERSRVPGERIF